MYLEIQTMDDKENSLAQKVIRDVVKSLVKQVIKSEKEIDKNRLKSSTKNGDIGQKVIDLTERIPPKTVNESKNLFQCALCYKTFRKKGGLKKHVENVHEQKKPTEQIEKTKHGRVKPFVKPQKSSQSKIASRYQCLICFKMFNKKETLKAHVETVHEVKKPFQCSLCPAKFGSEQWKTKHLASNHAITGFFKETQDKNQSENPEIKLIRATETRREYSLPFGWKKIGHRRSEIHSKERLERWDFYIFSPYGKMMRSAPEVKRYLCENPELECDLEVTNTSFPYDMNHLRPGWRASVKHEKTSHSEKKLSKKVTKTKHPKDIQNSSNQDISKMREKKKIALKNISCQLKEEEEKEQEEVELVSKELNHLAAILYVYAGGLNFMK